MERFVDVKHVLVAAGFLSSDLEIDILAETVTSLANQYGPRLTQAEWRSVLRNLSVVCEVINDQQRSEEFDVGEKINRTIEWLESDLTSSLGPARQKYRDRRGVEERRDKADRRRSDGLHYNDEERRRTDRRHATDRRDRPERRNDPDLF